MEEIYEPYILLLPIEAQAPVPCGTPNPVRNSRISSHTQPYAHADVNMATLQALALQLQSQVASIPRVGIARRSSQRSTNRHQERGWAGWDLRESISAPVLWSSGRMVVSYS
ncbi:hypothetical protein VF21_02543 [Pseudogymnoascus sp. 05NY08]|nr:hypothetical protein VF21_02543 [Pseudogymnoascus sp. 05NY08]